MSIKHYDVVRAASPSDLAEKLTHKLKEGWQPFGSPVAITPYTLMQAITAEGDVVVSGATEPDWYYVIVLAGQSNAMAYGEGLPLPDSYDAPDPRIKQLARRSTVTPGGAACRYNDIIPADHCLHDVGYEYAESSEGRPEQRAVRLCRPGVTYCQKTAPVYPE